MTDITRESMDELGAQFHMLMGNANFKLGEGRSLLVQNMPSGTWRDLATHRHSVWPYPHASSAAVADK
jgi:hypothetical protein